MNVICKKSIISAVLVFIIVFNILPTNLLVVYAEDDIATGTSGTCTWRIDHDGNLRIKPTSGTEGTLASMENGVNNSPWKDYSGQIKTVIFEGKVYGGESCSGLFRNCTNLINIENLNNFDTSNVTNMSSMFAYCSSIKNLDLSSFNTSKVTNMTGMFANCSSITKINLSSFDTKNVSDMHLMFAYCKELKDLDLNNFDTSKVTNMGEMFYHCESMKRFELNNFNTSNVTNMQSMFWNPEYLDLSSFDTSNVQNMYNIFTTSVKTIKLGPKTNLKTNVIGVCSQSFGRGTWEREEDGKRFSVVEICQNSTTGNATGTYNKVSNISNALSVDFPTKYKIEGISKIDEFTTNNNTIFENVDNKAILANINLVDSDDYQIPGNIQLTFKNVVTDENKNNYNLKMTIDNMHIYNLKKQEGIDKTLQSIVTISNNRISFCAGELYQSVEEYRSSNKQYINSDSFSQYDITMQIVDNSGNPVEGSYIFSMYDIDIPSVLDKDEIYKIPDGTQGYGKHSEGIELLAGFNMDTLKFSEDTFLWRLGNRITGTRMDNNSEFSEFLIEADSKGIKYAWGAGGSAESYILSHYQPQLVEIVKQNTKEENLSGAKLQLFYENTLKKEWTTTNNPVELFLMPGEYTLKEIQAPEGHKLAKEITFYVDIDNTLTRDGVAVKKIIMTDEPKDAKVTVHHYLIDELGNKTITQVPSKTAGQTVKDEIKNGKVFDTYTTSPSIEVSENYRLVQSQIPTNASGTYTETPIEVIYYYAKIPAKVTVKHLQKGLTDVDLAEEEIKNGYVGDPYTTERKEIANYRAAEPEPTNATGTYTEEEITVTYYYERIPATITVKHLDRETNEPVSAEGIILGYAGKEYTTKREIIPYYRAVKPEPENKEGTMPEGDTVVTYYYEKIPAKVTVRYLNTDGYEIKESKTENYFEGDKYVTAREKIENYRAAEPEPENKEGTVTEEEITVTYYYEKIPAKVITKYLDKEENEIIPSKEKDGFAGDEYKTTRETIENYRAVGEDPENKEGIMTEEDIIVTYYYEKIPAKVIVKYVDEDGKEIAPSENEEGYMGEEYSTEPKEIPYYEIVKEELPENQSGKYTKEEDNVIYHYRKLDFNIGVEKTLKDIIRNGISMSSNGKKLEKVEIVSSKTSEADVIVKYAIKVKNTGEIEGTAEILENIPTGYEISVDNPNYWRKATNGKLTTNVELKPGEEKELEVILKWKNGEFGSESNKIEITKTGNPANFEDSNSKDNTSEATVIMSIKTGIEAETVIRMVMLILTFIMIIGIMPVIAITIKK